MKIADAMNTYNLALEVIINEGFSIKIHDNTEDSLSGKLKEEMIFLSPLSILPIYCYSGRF